MINVPTFDFNLMSSIKKTSLIGKSKPKKYGTVINAAKCIDCKRRTITYKVESYVPTNH